MIAVDTNLLVYAHRREMPLHNRACELVGQLATGSQRWGIPDACLHEFYAIVTNHRVFSPPSTTGQAIDQINAWLESPTCRVIHSTTEHWPVLSQLADRAALMGGQIYDARIAAICLENGVSELCTADRDFARFPALKSRNPLPQA